MIVDIVSDERELLLLQPEWDVLWSSIADPYYFQSFSYVRACWQQMYKHERALLRCIVVRESGKVVLVWPLVVTKLAILRMLKPLAAGAAEYTQPLVKEGPEAVKICALAWSAARSRIKADIVSVPLVKEGSCLYAVLSRERPFSVHKDIGYWQKGGETWKDWDTFYKTVTAGHSLKTARKQRQLATQGTVRFEVMEQSPEVVATIDWCLVHKREWAKRVNKRGAWLYSDDFRNLLVAFFADEGSAQKSAILLLTLDGSPIAARISGYNKVKLEGIVSCFDARWAKYSPGSILDEHVARWAVERSLEHDFGVGAEAYKKMWSYNNWIAVKNFQFAGSLQGRLALMARQWWRARRERPVASRAGRDNGAPSMDGETA